MLRRIYDWALSLAQKRYAPAALGVISFTESSFSPLPPDVILVPMSLARPERAWFYAGLCTLTSVAGGVLGYLIGAVLYDSVGRWLIQLYGHGDGVETFRTAYAHYGAWIILIKGLTPIPYKLVTIASGFSGYDFLSFVILSLITRGARFFLLAGALHRYGDKIRKLLEEHLTLAVILLILIVIGGFVAVKYVV